MEQSKTATLAQSPSEFKIMPEFNIDSYEFIQEQFLTAGASFLSEEEEEDSNTDDTNN